MENNTTKYPALVFHPGVFLQDELDERQLTQAEFSAIIDRPPRTVNEIIKGKRGITPETAEIISAALGTSADMWLGMQSEFDLFILNKKMQGKTDEVKGRSKLYGMFPITDLVRRGYIKTRKNAEEIKKDVLAILGFKSLEEFTADKSMALCRKSEGDIVQSYLKSWIVLGKKQSLKLENIGKYNKSKLEDFSKDIRTYSIKKDGIKEIVSELNKLGVRVIILPHFTKTRVDGAACWLVDNQPVILLSLRYDRIDNFYFTLLHEIGHILLHNTEKTFVDVDIYRKTDDVIEKEANEFATERLGLKNISSEFKYSEPTPSTLSRRSSELEIHPALLIGHLQHIQLLDYSAYRKVLTRVRGSIPTEIVQK